MSKEFTILYYATARDATKMSSEKIPLPSQSPFMSLKDLTMLLKERHKKLAPILEYSLYAINMEYVENDQAILVKEGDEVAVIPPVSGG
ncbi:2406_t:CDS:2 [Funneliformis caledonium]|uniref:2406_t:CDS:1 n=2 Tax=Funneliformis TaxID=1117308 RepID=A0A9N9GPL6_9GLOM|nr:15373_t:CDS:2 [Funneliformis mosseae]CAG8620779.1 2406_t:CDS:2 [Funneliformis caledonium]